MKVELVHRHHAALAEREAYWEAELERSRPAIQFSNETENDRGLNQEREQSKAVLPVMLLLGFLGVSAAYLFAPQWQPSVRAAFQPLLASAHEDAKQTIYRLAPWLRPADTVVGVPIDPMINAHANPTGSNMLIVNAARVNLRAGPSLSSKVLRILDKSAQVRPSERNGDWVRVMITGDKVGTGWIHKSFLNAGRSKGSS